MVWVALKMLMGDRAKYLGLIFGIAFATLLMSQQVSIFVGIMRRTASQVEDVKDADLWVMDNQTRHVDEAPGMPEAELARVRGVEGVAWAVRMHKGQVRGRLEGGPYRTLVLFGLDDATLVGAPQEMVMGKLEDLRRPDAVIVDKAGYEYLWPGEPKFLGRSFEINHRRVILVGICKASPPFQTLPVAYTRFSIAAKFMVGETRPMSFILVKVDRGHAATDVVQRIRERTGLAAYTQDQFFWRTVNYFISSTGIPVNFGITIALGFIVGVAIAGQTFYLFTLENLKQFGSLKAMGVTNGRIVGMILVQAGTVGIIGFALGVGMTAVFFEVTGNITHLAGLKMYPSIMLGVGGAVMLIVLAASVLSVRKVLRLEPAMVFR